MAYTKREFIHAVEQFGEVFFVLDSDREYQVHGTESYEFVDRQGAVTESVRVEGMNDGEYQIAVFPLDSIEHHYTHKEI